MRHFRRHANGFAKGWMRVDGLADVHCVGTHLDKDLINFNVIYSISLLTASCRRSILRRPAAGAAALLRQLPFGPKSAFCPKYGHRP